MNRYVAHLPLFNRLCLVQAVVARLHPPLGVPFVVPPSGGRETPLKGGTPNDADARPTVSVIIPTLNEAGNIARAVAETPDMGAHTEIIFIDGHSTDGTVEAIQSAIKERPDRDMKFAFQDKRGKADAVRKGFEMASGDILMILDSDLTVAPEELPKFYRALTSGAGEMINGCRLVYPMEEEAMRTLNYYANHMFSWAFTWLLGQRVKDTLCGTKVLWKRDYERIKQGRAYFGDFDPFGDFDLLFGAARLGMKIIDLPIRYRRRDYGEIKIERFRHGWLLLKMCAFAARKMKFR